MPSSQNSTIYDHPYTRGILTSSAGTLLAVVLLEDVELERYIIPILISLLISQETVLFSIHMWINPRWLLVDWGSLRSLWQS